MRKSPEIRPRVCSNCGNEYKPTGTSQKYCASCKLQGVWYTEHYKKRSILCPCGKPTEYTAKFCSLECKRKYGSPRQRVKPDKVAICLTCGNEFSKPWHYPSQMKYCSNPCAQKHTKAIRHIVVKESDVVLDSTWEALFWGLCGFNKIEVERFDRQNAIEWKSNQWYAPDFWLPEYDLAVEIKGMVDDDDHEKWAATNEVMSLVILGRPELERLQKEEFISTLTSLS